MPITMIDMHFLEGGLTMYVYESHLGGLYLSYSYLDYDDTYCEECGDSDWFLGEFSDWEDFIGQIEVREVDYGDCKRTEAEFPGGCLGYGLEYMVQSTGLSKDRMREINPTWVKFEEEAEKEFLGSMGDDGEPDAKGDDDSNEG